MILCDTGPLVAMLDADDPYFVAVDEALHRLPGGRMLSTWACLTEAMYLLGKVHGHSAQEDLWSLLENGILQVQPLQEPDLRRMRWLMNKYRDAPMDFADASLVVAAETTGQRNILTLDHHFRTYLIHDRMPFDVIP